MEYSVESITNDLNERMSTHINSMCATEDEVSLAYLLCVIDELKEKLEKANAH